LPQTKQRDASASPVTINLNNENLPTEIPKPEPASDKAELASTWFWDLIYGFPKDDWGKIYDLQLWRRGLSKVQMAPGEKGWLEQYLEPVNLVTINSQYGGGLYHIVLNKNNKFKTSHDFEIAGQPKYDPRREVGPRAPAAPVNGNGDSNAALLAFQKDFISVLREEMARGREGQGNGAGSDRVIDMMANASEKAMDIVVSRATPPAVATPTQSLTELVSLVKSIIPTQSGGLTLEGIATLLGSPLVKPLIERLFAPTDPLDQLGKLAGAMEVMDRIRGTGGGGDGKPKDWKAMLAEAAMTKGPEIIREFRESNEASLKMQQERRAANEAIERAEAIRRQNPNAVVQAAPGAQTVPAPAPRSSGLRTVAIHPEAAPDISQDRANGQPAAAQLTKQDAEMVVTNFVKNRVVSILFADSEAGDSVDDIAEHIIDFLEDASPETVEELKNNPPPLINAFFAEDPIMKVAVGHPKWGAVLDAARAYILDGQPEPAEQVPS
jgi:hypothetical protein